MACGIHYQYHHKYEQQIFSIARFKRESSFKFSLSSNFLPTKGFPHHSSVHEINLLECSFDMCHFKTVHFHSFKRHAISCHSFYFDGPWSCTKNEEPTVNVKVRTYATPSGYSHFPLINKKSTYDNKNEIEAIQDLLALYKGHFDKKFKRIYSELNRRKYELEKNLTRMAKTI